MLQRFDFIKLSISRVKCSVLFFPTASITANQLLTGWCFDKNLDLQRTHDGVNATIFIYGSPAYTRRPREMEHRCEYQIRLYLSGTHAQ